MAYFKEHFVPEIFEIGGQRQRTTATPPRQEVYADGECLRNGQGKGHLLSFLGDGPLASVMEKPEAV